MGIVRPMIECPPKGGNSKLPSLVRVMNDSLRRPAAPGCHIDGFDDELTAQVIGHRLADDELTVDIENRRQRVAEKPRAGQ